MSLIDDIIAELKSKWNGTTVTEPIWFNGEFSDPQKKMPTGDVLDQEIDQDPASCDLSAMIQTSPFEIKLYTKSRADAILSIGEVIRILHSKAISGGWWQIMKHDTVELGRVCSTILTGQQVKFIIVS